MPRAKAKSKTITCRYGHRIRTPEWPSSEGMAILRRHYKRQHPRGFKRMMAKSARTRARSTRRGAE